MSTVDFRTKYGAWETNGLEDADGYFSVEREQVALSDRRRTVNSDWPVQS